MKSTGLRPFPMNKLKRPVAVGISCARALNPNKDRAVIEEWQPQIPGIGGGTAWTVGYRNAARACQVIERCIPRREQRVEGIFDGQRNRGVGAIRPRNPEREIQV